MAISKVELKVERPATETLPVSDIGELAYAVVLKTAYEGEKVIGLFSHRNYAERYLKDGSGSLSIREVA